MTFAIGTDVTAIRGKFTGKTGFIICETEPGRYLVEFEGGQTYLRRGSFAIAGQEINGFTHVAVVAPVKSAPAETDGIHWLSLTYSDVVTLINCAEPCPFPGFIDGIHEIASTWINPPVSYPVTNPELQWAIDTLMAH